ncbi:hypothetical protein GT347_00160 [Xylophilus rhododendri]|uniref:Uncharacterized protein n=1 Tax=Xylophilus rhododendri TaxID=2697032 RepID=A0A857IZ24_9BURK|nr:hypothetical protein [Xylophilus rhododendri]QHI96547.1 hypothetical protein GT347_00160 [Xylophilus rhododendri]
MQIWKKIYKMQRATFDAGDPGSALGWRRGVSMGQSIDRTRFSGTAYLYQSGGNGYPFRYEGSYSRPRRDRQGCMRFGWTATVVGMDRQPQPRTSIVDDPAIDVPGFVEQHIRRSIQEHVAVFAKRPASLPN